MLIDETSNDASSEDVPADGAAGDAEAGDAEAGDAEAGDAATTSAPAASAPAASAPAASAPAASAPRGGGRGSRGGGQRGGGQRGGGPGGRGRGRGGRDNRNEGPEQVVQIRRCSCVVKGGRRFSFSAMVVVGDQAGRVGWGYGKAIEVPLAVEKAVKNAERQMVDISIVGTTIPHQVVGRYGAAKVLLLPASPGTGIIAGDAVRAVVESVGLSDILTKSRGSNNPINLVKATLDGLKRLRTREAVQRLRGVEFA